MISPPTRLNAGSDDFVPIEPATLNWEKIGPDQDVFISALSQNGHVNVKVISAKNMVQSIREKRELSGVATELLGRVMLSTMLVANGIKDDETLQLTFNGDGQAKGVMAISDGACNVRAWIGNSDLDDLRDPETGKADIKAAVGRGTLQVVKNHPSWRIPYNGVVEIASGEVAPDVAFYLASSEQRNTALGVGLSVDPVSGDVASAGGFYIEMMPGVEEESVLKVEVNLAVIKERFGSVDAGQLFALKEPVTPYKLVKMLLDGKSMEGRREGRKQKRSRFEEIDKCEMRYSLSSGRVGNQCYVPQFCILVHSLTRPPPSLPPSLTPRPRRRHGRGKPTYLPLHLLRRKSLPRPLSPGGGRGGGHPCKRRDDRCQM